MFINSKIKTQKLFSPIVVSFSLPFSFARPAPASSIVVCRFQCSFRQWVKFSFDGNWDTWTETDLVTETDIATKYAQCHAP